MTPTNRITPDPTEADPDAQPDLAARLRAALAAREERIRWLEGRLSAPPHPAAPAAEPAILRAASWLVRQTDRWAPQGSPRRAGLGRLARGATRVAGKVMSPRRTGPPRPTDDGDPGCRYSEWLAEHDPTREDVERLREEGSHFAERPLISVLVPVYNSEPAWLEEMAGSVTGQAYDRWELCLADDGSTDPRVGPALQRLAASDPRIQVRRRERNGGIAAASNTALEMASGEFVALLDHDDVLRPHALHTAVAALQAEPDLDLLYSDEDKILLGGDRGHVAFKGEFDPDHLLSTNYICHLCIIRRSLLARLGGFHTGLDGSQDHDLLLRVTEATTRIRHLPAVLYSWRQVPGSAAVIVDAKPLAWENGRRAVDEALVRRGGGARAELGPRPGLYRVRRPLPASAHMTLIVHGASAAVCARSLEALTASATSSPLAVMVTGTDPELASLRHPGLEVITGERPERRAALLNQAIAVAQSEVVILVRAGLTPASADGWWLAAIAEEAYRSEVGLAGGRIIGGAGQPVHEGFRLGRGPAPVSLGTRWPVVQRVAAVSGNLMAFRTQAVLAAGGFDERYWLDLWDVDLAFRMGELGLAVVYTPFCELIDEGGVAEAPPAADDLESFGGRWGPVGDMADPFLSPHLDSIQPLRIRRTPNPARKAG